MPKKARLVYLAGLDGSGKSTQGERFLEAAVQRGELWEYRWARWEPRVMGPLMSLGRRIASRGSRRGSKRPEDESGYAEFTAGKRRIFQRGWLRRLWTTLVLIEFLPQAWWRLLPPLMRGRNVLCDRYLPDLWVDLATNFGQGPEGVAQLSRHPLCRLVPWPSQVVYLDVDPEVGFRRKSDGTPLGYLEDRRPLYLSLAEILPFRAIDANRGLDEVAQDLQRHLLGE